MEALVCRNEMTGFDWLDRCIITSASVKCFLELFSLLSESKSFVAVVLAIRGS